MHLREYAEVAVIFGSLLITRWIDIVNPFPLNFGFAGTRYYGWYAVYVATGLTLPVIMEKIVRKRKFSVIGFQLPTGKRESLRITTLIIISFLIGGIINRFRLGFGLDFDPERIASVCIFLPFIEEVNFLGLIQTRLETGLGKTKAWIISGLLFGFWHYWVHFLIIGRPLTVTYLVQISTVTAFGCVLGWIYAETKSLLPTLILHGINNFVAVSHW